MVTIKSYTDLEQSKKLAEILPLKSADMHYWCGKKIRIGGYKTMDKDLDIPCWSLAALLALIPEVSLNTFKDADRDNPVDACYELILKLHELKVL